MVITKEEKIEKLKPYIQDILDCEAYMQIKEINHHWEFSIFDHCVDVAYSSFVITKALGLDYKSTARGAMLHDFFLYNWRQTVPEEGLHGFVHARIAYENSIKHFELNKKETDIILKHMFPLNIRPPRYLESFIVCMEDKICATREVVEYIFECLELGIIKSKKKIFVSQFVYSLLYIFLIR